MIDDGESSSEEGEEEVDFVDIKPVDFDADTFSMTVVALARDSYFLEKGGKNASVWSRYVRIALTLMLAAVTPLGN